MLNTSEHSFNEVAHPATLVELLRLRASRQPDEPAYTFLPDGETTGEVHLTYEELDRRARAIGGWLQRHEATGQRVLLLHPSGLEYIAAFFGCIYAGAVAVPAYPPRRNRSISRLQSIITDARATFALTTRAVLSALEPVLAENPGLQSLRWLTLDAEIETHLNGWRDPGATSETLAFLQYSSGSTSAPKGVMVSHGNLLHNQRVIQSAFQQTENSVIVGWLPLHHDMGLIGNVIQPLYLGARCVLMSPMSFLQRPVRWLQAISHYRATTSGGPNFAYDLCVRRVSEEQRARLDLSRWGVAFNGSEPVRAETLDEFAGAFASCGFRREAFQPCYGLAEATLMVTGGRTAAPPTVKAVCAEALADNKVTEVEEGSDAARRLVGSGHSFFNQRIAIVNPETLTLCAPDEVGEIWFSGPSVAQGYWDRPEETERTFRATFEGAESEQFLRTGDLGFLQSGELFVTGRLKDLIIILGRNLYPQDIELTVERCHPSLRPHSAAAFSVERSGVERLVVMLETAPRRQTDFAGVIDAIREAVAREHEVQPHAVVLIKPGGLPKTSSGKIQRYVCRAMFLEKSLEVVAEWQAADPTDEGLLDETGDLESWLATFLALKLGIDAQQIDAEQPIIKYGLDSLLAVELAHAIERAFGVSLGIAQLLQNPSISEIASRLRDALDEQGHPAETTRPVPQETTRLPLSEGQKAMWLLHQFAPQSAAYNIASAVRVNSELDAQALRRAFQTLLERHEALRTTFTSQDGEPFQLIGDGGALYFREHEASAWSERELQDVLATEAHRPFNLEAGPLLRVHLFTRSAREHILLLTVHHIVADFWSFAVLLRELGALYEAELNGVPISLPSHPMRYADYVQRQRQLVESPQGEQLWEYWQSRLSGELPVLNLPTDRPRPPAQTFNGNSHFFEVEPELALQLKAIGRERGATLYMTLLATFEALLYRYTGQEDLTVGSPTSGRNWASLSGLVGYFVNPVVLREQLSGEMTFESLLAQVRQTVLEAFAHQEYPFARLVERLQPTRDHSRSPLFQTFFSLQKAPLQAGEDFAAFALGESGARLALGGLALESVALELKSAQFDLALLMADAGGGLSGSLQYNTDLLDAATVERMAQHFKALLADVCAAPSQRLSELTLLSQTERRRLLVELNDSERDYPGGHTLSELFEAQVARTPEAIAVSFDGTCLTYGELNARVERLAHQLRGLGVVAEARVGLLLEHSLELVTGLLAVLKAGGAYVPLDVHSPPERLRFMLEDAAVVSVLTQRGTREKLPAQFRQSELCLDSDLEPIDEQPATDLLVRVNPASTAYVIYTSGSTGKPKGVSVQHSSVVNYIAWAQDEYLRGKALDFPLYSSLAFDLTVTSIFAPLLSGGRVVIYRARERFSPLEEVLRDDQVDVLKLTPGHLALLKDRDNRGSRIRLLIVGGEALETKLARAVYDSFGGSVEIINEYGPTEATVGCMVYRYDAERDARAFVPIGRPLANTQVYVLDQQYQPSATGAHGQLYVGGHGLARGYLNRSDLTAERFVPDPFSVRPGARLYATGDLARYLPDGQIEFLGRRDSQIKVRGFRIELGEIEAALSEHPRVRAAVAQAVSGGGENQLVAYAVCGRDADAPSTGQLRDFLKQRVPEYMMPTEFVLLENLPLTPNGKVDRRALPAPEKMRHGWLGEFVAPRTPAEELLANIWAEALDLGAEPGVHDDFFELGGHSLKGMSVLARVREAFGVELPLRSIFESPTVAKLAAHIEEVSGTGAGRATPPPKRAEREGVAPLSFAQQRLWFLDQLEGGSSVYNIPGAVQLTGALDVEALHRSVNEVVRRHETLRATFPAPQGQPAQVVVPDLVLPLPVVDLRMLAGAEREAEADSRMREEARRPFDLRRGPLLRVSLLWLGEREHVLLVTMHHIVSDEWSLGVFVRELAALYEAYSTGHTPSPLPALDLQYSDYASWQRERLQGEILEDQIAYWRRQLEGASYSLELPTDRPRPAVQTLGGARHYLQLPHELSAALKRLSRSEGTTLFMTLLAAFQLLLSRYTGQEDILVGTPVTNRDFSETEKLIGFFVNMLVLRGDLSGDPDLRTFLARVREAALSAFAHRETPFEKLVEELQPARDLDRHPLFQVLFQLDNSATYGLNLPGLNTTLREVESGTAKFDLEFNLTSGANGIAGFFEYNTSLFDASTIARMSTHFENLLHEIVRNPARRLSEFDMLDADEERRLLSEWNDTQRNFPLHSCFPELFEAQVRRTPDAIAVNDDHQQFTYEQLNRRANRLARLLIRAGVGAETIVSLLAERGSDFLTAVLAVFKAGAAYLPLDPKHPAKRTAQVLEQSRSAFVLVAESLAANLREALGYVAATKPATLVLEQVLTSAEDERHDGDNLPLRVRPRNLAYVIFTSGSTGVPKGAMIEHVGMVNHLYSKIEALDMQASDVVAQNASQCFDISVWQFLAPLLTGGRVHVINDEVAHDPARLLAEAVGNGVTILEIVPSMLRATVETLAQAAAPKPDCSGLKWLVVTGEAFAPDLCREWLRLYPSIPAVNAYGPTECSDDVTHYFASTPPSSLLGYVLVGRPLPNTKLYIVDRRLRPVPIGVHGELYVGGSGVGRGYLHNPVKTAGAFIPDPFSDESGARMYRTGDLVRYEPDGNINFLERIDHQVKIRGFRIELGEIEAALRQHPEVSEAVVLAGEDAARGKRLIAYVVLRHPQSGSASNWREFLRDRLPDYMVPSVLVRLERLPVTTSGKINRRALPPPADDDGFDAATSYTAPRDPVEQAVADIWADLLQVKQVGIHDNFFELGGHSLLATQLVSRLRDGFQADLPLRMIFEKPTVADMAQAITQAQAAPKKADRQRIQARPRGNKNFDQLMSKVEQLSE